MENQVIKFMLNMIYDKTTLTDGQRKAMVEDIKRRLTERKPDEKI